MTASSMQSDPYEGREKLNDPDIQPPHGIRSHGSIISGLAGLPSCKDNLEESGTQIHGGSNDNRETVTCGLLLNSQEYSSKLVDDISSKSDLRPCAWIPSHQQSLVLYYKTDCRKRILKGCSNIEYKISRTKREALAHAKAVEAYKMRLPESTSLGTNTTIPATGRRSGGSEDLSAALHKHGANAADLAGLPSGYSVNGHQKGHNKAGGTLVCEDVIAAIKSTIASIRDMKVPVRVSNQVNCPNKSRAHQVGWRTRSTRRVASPHSRSHEETTAAKSVQNHKKVQCLSVSTGIGIQKSTGVRSNDAKRGEIVGSEVQTSPSCSPNKSPPQRTSTDLRDIDQNTSAFYTNQPSVYGHFKPPYQTETMSGRTGARMGYSKRNVSTPFNPSDSCTPQAYNVQDVEVRTRSRPRGFQPSEVGKSKPKVEATSTIEAGEISGGSASKAGSHRSHELALSHPNNSSQTSATSLKMQGISNSKFSSVGAQRQSVAPHVTRRVMENALDSRSKDTSHSTSCAKSSVQLITDEQKPSCWARGTGPASNHLECATTKSEWANDFHQASKDVPSLRPDSEEDVLREIPRRADFGRLPKYHFPSGIKKAVDNPRSSFERQKAYVKPGESLASSAGMRLAELAPDRIELKKSSKVLEKTSKVPEDAEPTYGIRSANDASSAKPITTEAPSRKIRDDRSTSIPPHRRLEVLNPLNQPSQSKNIEPQSQVDRFESQYIHAQKKAFISSNIESSESVTENKPKSLVAHSETEYLTSGEPSALTQPLSTLNNDQHQSNTSNSKLPVTPETTRTAVSKTSSTEDVHCKNLVTLHRGGQDQTTSLNSMNMDKTLETCLEETSSPVGRQIAVEPHNLGSGLNLSGALKDITNEVHSEYLKTKPVIKQSATVESFANGRTKHQRSSIRKGKKSEWEDPHYEMQLVDYKGDFLPAPIGEEWQIRDQYNNPDERFAVLQEYAEDQAIDPEQVAPAVNIHSPSFLAGQTVLDDECVDELDLDDTQRTALPGHTFRGQRSRVNKTAQDAIKEYAGRLEKLGPSKDLTKMPMTKEQKRLLRRALIESERNYVPPPNPHAPEANIYLRPVETSDSRQVTDIWNHYVLTSAAVPIIVPDEPRLWHDNITEAGKEKQPFIVAVLMGDKASGNQRQVRRLKQEHIVGFARATDFGYSNNAYRYTVEFEVYVQDGHLHKGIGKTLFDRLMAAIATDYTLKECAPFLCSDGVERWSGGGHRIVKTILFNMLHHDNDKDLDWKKKWLEREHFQQSSSLPKIGYKLGKPVNLLQYYYETLENITPVMSR